MNKKKHNLFKSTLKLSLGILINKPIGFLRDILQMKYFGLTLLGDAYIIAWRIPNVLRRIFSEGLMTSVLLPYLLKIKAEEKEEMMNQVITAIIIIMQIIITLFCFIIAFHSKKIMLLLSPGALDRIQYGAEMLQILIFFTFFTSFSSILGVAVQLYKKFYLGPLSQFFLNIFFCIELFFSLKYKFSYLTLCTMISLNSIIIVIIHLYAFLKNNFYFIFPNKKSIYLSLLFFKNFFIAFLSSLLLEINTFAGLSLSSYLAAGSLSLFEYVNTLIRLPLQVFGSAIASTSQVDIGEFVYKKEYNLLENKIYFFFKIFFLLSFCSLLGIFLFSERFFEIFFSIIGLSHQYVLTASNLFSILSFMIFPALANKILLNIFYSFHSVSLPTLITFFISLISNFCLWFYVKSYGLYTIAFANVGFETIRFFIFFMIIKHNYKIIIFNQNNKENFIYILKIVSYFLSCFFLLTTVFIYITQSFHSIIKADFIRIINFLVLLLYFGKKYHKQLFL